ncbi:MULTISPECIES: hypothetical protein [Erythrobacteraceae]|jgi:hypothetical protein|uniref:hypothetical protein n=1 Tax=Erythrobacteraceae TaxID=335929 RepID=UPI00273F85A4|nr:MULTISPECIES: hypothetical protein [Erythrobacteraceae]MDP5263342.1 hypothetical protein [Aurantiacibacter sp. 219JJ12-13]WBY18097.1 hypothetical protein PF049_13725 [Erythrobacteraceae bacterium WH01K]WPL55527.1 hypothetical protein SD421_00285 [Qipengyuania sp. HL-TH5]|tara:strand:+ start:7094 stop:7591 length:498 start_codon:yes stop_codon:yes gene_type:complete
MNKAFAVGRFDLDIALRDASLDELNRATRRSLANASIGVEAFDAYHSARELFETLEAVHEGQRGAKRKLTQVLSCECDDYQRCLYYTLAGRGVLQMLDDLEWLIDLLKARCEISASLFRSGTLPSVQINPYVSAEPDGPVPPREGDFEQGASWFLDPALGGEIGE